MSRVGIHVDSRSPQADSPIERSLGRRRAFSTYLFGQWSALWHRGTHASQPGHFERTQVGTFVGDLEKRTAALAAPP